MSQPKLKKKMGRPKLSNGETKKRVVPIRFSEKDLKRIEAAAKANQKTVSEWVRGTLATALGSALNGS